MKATLTAVAAVAAIALSPVASAATHQKVVWVDGQTAWIAIDYPSGAQGYRFTTDTLAPGGKTAAQSAKSQAFITDTLAAGGKTHQEPAEGLRLITDTLAPGGDPSLGEGTDSSPFSWADAGIGAGAASGALFLIGGGAMLALRRRGALAI